jgi:hypothetical protein
VTEADRRAELLRQFEAVIGGAELDDLRALAGELSRLGSLEARERSRPRRPELRQSRLKEVRRFVVRVDLRQAKPPIWRRLEIRSDLTLDVVHRVLQAAFGWTDSHLWRFALGGDPFDPSSQVFLCPWDEEEGEEDDEDGIPASTVRLDETVQNAGEVLSYVYDYGDHWELTLRVEHVLPATLGAPSAVAVDGRRAAPPEDCGSCCTAEELGEVLEDPALFDLGEVNQALRSPFLVLREHGFDPRLVGLLDRLMYSPLDDEFTSRVLSLLQKRPVLDDAAVAVSLRPFVWFLDRAADGGIPLTTSGYMKRADVAAIAEVLPGMRGWIGKSVREIDAAPVLHFRMALQKLRLLRKHKGSLMLTRGGRAAGGDLQTLWKGLADRLVSTADGFEADATRLLLVYVATSRGEELPLDTIAAALTHLGWRGEDGSQIVGYDLYALPAVEVLLNVTNEQNEHTDRYARWRVSAPAAALARTALQQP